jgi:hypothetical protein
MYCILFEKLNLKNAGVSGKFSEQACCAVCTFQMAVISLAWNISNP